MKRKRQLNATPLEHTAPVLRWAGSKRKLVPTLQMYWEYAKLDYEADFYVEPFAGSCALFFAANPTKSQLSDINSELIGALATLSRHASEVHALAASIPVTPNAYYQVRSLVPTQLSNVQQAARFIYLNRYCFNGLYRTNLKGAFNVPFGGWRSGSLPGSADFEATAKKLTQAQLICEDFRSAIQRQLKPKRFFYLDPPYAKANASLRQQYGPATFGVQDLLELGVYLEKIDDAGSHFLFSYADCSEIDFLCQRWTLRKARVLRSIAANPAARRNAVEVLISNFELQ